MNLKWLGVLLVCVMANPALAGLKATVAPPQGGVTSTAVGAYQPAERKLLATSFIAAVNSYLHRYDPTLVDRNDEHVRMQVQYQFVFAIDLTIRESEFDIKVTVAQKQIAADHLKKAQADAAKLSAGVLRQMEDELLHNARGARAAQ